MTEGNTLVIAPVLWRVPFGATFRWTVNGTSAYTVNGEYLTFTSSVTAGNYSVTVMKCINASSPASENRTFNNEHAAAGGGSYGYQIVNNSGQISGNTITFTDG